MRIARRAAFPAALASLVVVHFFLTFWYERPAIIFSTEPNDWLDYDTHIEQVWRFTEAMDGWGKTWSYDVQLLAGYPNGTIFDADNKGWELWTYGLWKLGVPKGLAFNLFILLAHLGAPWAVFAAARMFRLGWWPSLLAAALGLALWYFDAFPHWCWWVGMIAYATVGWFCLLPLALMYRYVSDGGWWRAALIGLLLAWGHLVHPYLFVILVAPMGALYVRGFKTMGWQRHVGLALAALVTIAANAWWLVVSIRFWHYILDSSFYCQSTLTYILTDWLGLIKEPLVTGVLGQRTGFRFLCLVSGGIMLWIWRKERDDRFLPLVVGIGLMLAVTYLGGYWHVTRQIQPYRHILPAMFMATIPAAAFFDHLIRSGALRKLPRLAWAFIVVIALVAVPHLARDVLYFFPVLVPVPKEIPPDQPHVMDIHGFGGLGYPKHMEFRHMPTWKDYDAMAAWVEENVDDQGRVLVEHWILGEHLAWRTDAQILGGFRERNLAHSAANFFRRWPEGEASHEQMARYFEDYAVEWVILSHKVPAFEVGNPHIEAVRWIPPHRIYRVRGEPSFFQENGGHVKPSMNLLEVRGTDPAADVVLRFHWLETLVCEPDCSIARESVLGDPVGFIRVPAPHPADFDVVNGY